MKTIKARILVRSTLILFITIAILTTINIAYLGGQVMAERKNELAGQTEDYAGQVYSQLQEQKGFLQSFQQAVISTDGDEDMIQSIINSLYASSPDLMNIYYGVEADGTFIHAENGGTLSSDYDPRVRDWYNRAKDEDTMIVSNPYMANSTHLMCATIAAPVYMHGTFTGVVGIDIPLDNIIALVDNNINCEATYGFLLDEDLNFVTHPNEAYLPTTDSTTNLSSVSPALLDKIQSGDYSVKIIDNWEGVSSFFAVANVGDTGWYLVSVMSVKAARINLHWSFVNTAVISVICIIIAFLVCNFIVRREISPITAMIPTAEQIGNGDLDTHLHHTMRKDEVGDLQNSLVDMAENIRAIINEQKLILEEVSKGNLMIRDMHEFPGEYNRIPEQVNSIKATLNDLIINIQLAAEKLQHTALTSQLDASPEEIAAVFDELSDEANDLMDKANAFITKY